MFGWLLSGVLAFAAPALASAEEIHSSHCLRGCPAGGPPTNDVIVREIYVLSSNDETKFADWVAYRLTAETMAGSEDERNFKKDPLLARDETLERADYTGAHDQLGTDRGHQAPLADFTGTDHWRDTNFLSNITPQSSDLNQGSWKRLEEAVRNLVTARGHATVFVMTGTLYERVMPSLPGADEDHRIPSGYWKVVSVPADARVEVAGFVFDQDTDFDADFCDHLVLVREIEDRAELDFFHAVSQSRQDAIETEPGGLSQDLGCPS